MRIAVTSCGSAAVSLAPGTYLLTAAATLPPPPPPPSADDEVAAEGGMDAVAEADAEAYDAEADADAGAYDAEAADVEAAAADDEAAAAGEGEEEGQADADGAVPPAPEAAAAAAEEEEEGAPSAEAAVPCVFTLSASSDAPIAMGDLPTVCTEQLGLCVSHLSGEMAEGAAGEWMAALAVGLTPSAACSLAAELTVDAADAADGLRITLVGEDTREAVRVLGLSTGALPLDPSANPSGYTLLVDVRPAAPRAACGWQLRLTSTAEVGAAIAEATPADLADVYPPNDGYRLFRLLRRARCSAAVHVACNEPRARLLARAIAITSSGGEEPRPRPSSVRPGARLRDDDGGGRRAAAAAAGKGQEAPPGTTIVLEAHVEASPRSPRTKPRRRPHHPRKARPPRRAARRRRRTRRARRGAPARRRPFVEGERVQRAAGDRARPGARAGRRAQGVVGGRAAGPRRQGEGGARPVPYRAAAGGGGRRRPRAAERRARRRRPDRRAHAPGGRRRHAGGCLGGGGQGRVEGGAGDGRRGRRGRRGGHRRAEAVREAMAGETGAMGEAVAAERAKVAEQFSASAAEREALLAKLLPAPAEAEAPPAKGKKK